MLTFETFLANFATWALGSKITPILFRLGSEQNLIALVIRTGGIEGHMPLSKLRQPVLHADSRLIALRFPSSNFADYEQGMILRAAEPNYDGEYEQNNECASAAL